MNSYRCPEEDWVDFEELGCYHFGTSWPTENMTYFEAAYYCHRKGGFVGNGGILAEPPNSLVQDVLTMIASDLDLG